MGIGQIKSKGDRIFLDSQSIEPSDFLDNFHPYPYSSRETSLAYFYILGIPMLRTH